MRTCAKLNKNDIILIQSARNRRPFRNRPLFHDFGSGHNHIICPLGRTNKAGKACFSLNIV